MMSYNRGTVDARNGGEFSVGIFKFSAMPRLLKTLLHCPRLRPFLETEEGLATLNNVLHEAAACNVHTARRARQTGDWTGLDWNLEPEGRPGGKRGLRPLLWQAALHYWSAGRASELSFVDL